MTIHLDHTIVPARDKVASAKLLADLLGVPWAESGIGPFSPVYVNDGLTLDFIETDEAFPVYHFCFRVPQKEFDAILSRLKAGESNIAAPCAGRWTCKSTPSMAAAWSIGTNRKGISGRC